MQFLHLRCVDCDETAPADRWLTIPHNWECLKCSSREFFVREWVHTEEPCDEMPVCWTAKEKCCVGDQWGWFERRHSLDGKIHDRDDYDVQMSYEGMQIRLNRYKTAFPDFDPDA